MKAKNMVLLLTLRRKVKKWLGVSSYPSVLTVKEVGYASLWKSVRDHPQEGLCLWWCLEISIPFPQEGVEARFLWTGAPHKTSKEESFKKRNFTGYDAGELVMTDHNEISTFYVDGLTLSLTWEREQQFKVSASLTFPEEIPLGSDYNKRFMHLHIYGKGFVRGICVVDHDVTAIASDFRDPQWLRKKILPLVDFSCFDGPIYPDPWPQSYIEPIKVWFVPKS